MTRISRRTFIRMWGSAVGATALAGCVPPPAPGAPTPPAPATATLAPAPSTTSATSAATSAPAAGPTAAPAPAAAGRAYDAVKPGPPDMDLQQRWLAGVTEGGKLPISMTYDDQDWAAASGAWQAASSRTLDGQNTEYVFTRHDPVTGLTVRWQAIAYTDFPAVEWVVYLKNEGQSDTPILEAIKPLDLLFPAAPDETCTLLYANGSQMKFDDFAPQTKTLTTGRVSPGSVGGRSSDGALPFCNMRLGQMNLLVGIGWTGDWELNFLRPEGTPAVQVNAGMYRTHLRLHPGEEIRTPRILLLFWEGESLRGNNLLRRFLLAHKVPRRAGRPVMLPIVDGSWGERTGDSQVAKIRWLQEQKLDVEAFWIDAGWYGDLPFDPMADTFGVAWANQVGSWYPNKNTYPQGLRPIGDACRAAGLDFVLWFEPERVHKDTDIARNHFAYTLDSKLPPAKQTGPEFLFDLGDPAARQWLTDRMSSLIEEGRVTIFRQDFNMSPSATWLAADVAEGIDRIGIHEIRHIEGLYTFLDDLVARHPGLLIDNCASGGRRLDLEMMARSFPLHPSDIFSLPASSGSVTFMQNLTNSLSLWYPAFLSREFEASAYGMRSALGSGMGVGWSGPALESHETLPLDLIRRHTREELDTRKYFYGDFYSLSAPALSTTVWAAWQFDRPDLGEGIVQVFRRPDSEQASATYPLRGLDPDAHYEIVDADTGQATRSAGRDLLTTGLPVHIQTRPAAALLRYRKV